MRDRPWTFPNAHGSTSCDFGLQRFTFSCFSRFLFFSMFNFVLVVLAAMSALMFNARAIQKKIKREERKVVEFLFVCAPVLRTYNCALALNCTKGDGRLVRCSVPSISASPGEYIRKKTWKENIRGNPRIRQPLRKGGQDRYKGSTFCNHLEVLECCLSNRQQRKYLYEQTDSREHRRRSKHASGSRGCGQKAPQNLT